MGEKKNIYKNVANQFSKMTGKINERASLVFKLISQNKIDFFDIYEDKWEIPSEGNYIKNNLFIKSKEDNPFYKGSFKLTIRLWNNLNAVDIEDEYEFIYKTDFFKKNFEVNTDFLEQDNKINFIEQFSLFLKKNNSGNRITNASILVDAYKSGELKIDFIMKSDKYISKIYDIKITTLQIGNTSLLIPGTTFSLVNINFLLVDKPSLSELSIIINNEILLEREINESNYNSSKIKDKILIDLDIYFEKKPENSIYNHFSKILFNLKSELSISVIKVTRAYDIFFNYRITPKIGSKIFKDNSSLTVKFKSVEKNKDQNFSIYSPTYYVEAWSNWSTKYEFNSKSYSYSIRFTDIPGINNWNEFKKNYKNLEPSITANFHGYGKGDDHAKILGNEVGSSLYTVNLSEIKEGKDNEIEKNHPKKFSYKKGTTKITGRLSTKIYHDEDRIYFQTLMYGSTYGAGIPKARLKMDFTVNFIKLKVG